MSTIFGIKKDGKTVSFINDMVPYDIDMDDFEIFCTRTNGGHFVWRSEVYPMILPRILPVYPLDNTAQGIYCIGDIFDKISI